MKNKRKVFVLGAGASCPYGYPSGARLREWICLPGGFKDSYFNYRYQRDIDRAKENRLPIDGFIKAFSKSSKQSIDLFMATNPKLAPTAKYVIAFVTFKAEERSQFREEAKIAQESYSSSPYRDRAKDFLAKGYFQGEDWYLYLFNRLTASLIKPDVLPDFSDDKIAFITFNYDRSLEHFLYESLSNSFKEVPVAEIIQCLKKLKILHVYGQIVPLKWQDSEQGVDYKPQITEPLLQKSVANIKTIYEQKESPELRDAQQLLTQAEQIFFLGFGYAPENMEVLGLPGIISPQCLVYGTGFNLIPEEINRDTAVHGGRKKTRFLRCAHKD